MRDDTSHRETLDRASSADAKRTIQAFFPDESTRKSLLKLLAADIERAARINRKSWSINLHPRGIFIRLNVGMAFALDLRNNQVTLIEYDPDAAKTAPTSGLIKDPKVPRRAFKSVPGTLWRKYAADEFIAAQESIVERHWKAIEIAASSATPFASAYSSGVVDMVNEELDINLSQREVTDSPDVSPTAGLIDTLRSCYPDWDGFDHPTFVKEEIDYKKEASRLAKELLSAPELRRLIGAGDYDEIIQRIDKVAHATNLLFVSVPRSGDLRLVHQDGLDKQRFCEAFLDLLHGDGESPVRLDRFFEAPFGSVKGYWTFPTYFLYLIHPDEDVFIKPTATRRFLSLLNSKETVPSKPSGTAYRNFLALAAGVLEELEDYGASDMIDFQSLLWVCAEVQNKPRYWKIAPGRNAWQWEESLKEGFIGMGWEQLGDVSHMTEDEFREKALEFEERGEFTEYGSRQLWKFVHEVKQGDGVVANDGTKRVLGVGKIVGPYVYQAGSKQPHIRAVEWTVREPQEAYEPGWKRTLVELKEDKFQSYLDKESVSPPKPDPEPISGGLFTEETFNLLGRIHKDPTLDFYNKNKDDLKTHVEQPFHDFMHAVIRRLSEPILERLETRKRLFSRFPKNDWGRGGAWDFIWGALYPKGRKRSESTQLWAVLKHHELTFGFGFGTYSSEEANRVLRHLKANREYFRSLLRPALADKGFLFGKHLHLDLENSTESFDDWLDHLDERGIEVWKAIPRPHVLARSADDLVQEISEAFEVLLPLVIASLSDEPLDEIRALQEDDISDEDEPNPEISLASIGEETGFDETELDRWVRAIRRKGQAVFYGPPGTGKTFIAEKLAGHLIGGGFGFAKLVQFHPAYSYEDFMQGIRPKVGADDSLSYEMVSGRFLTVCREAQRSKGNCVLIVDEINRANLARVFGELMYLLEYRNREIPLAGGNSLRVPNNLFLLGTMNTADRSIALVDHALRRRFAFLALRPQYSILRKFHAKNGFSIDGLISVLEDLNRQIADPNYEVGISFFLDDNLEALAEDIWRMEIEPYVEEYFFDQQEKADRFRWDRVETRILG